MKVLFLCRKCSKNPPTSIFHSKNFPGGYTPVKGEGERKKTEGKKEEGGEGEGLCHGCWGMDVPDPVHNKQFLLMHQIQHRQCHMPNDTHSHIITIALIDTNLQQKENVSRS